MEDVKEKLKLWKCVIKHSEDNIVLHETKCGKFLKIHYLDSKEDKDLYFPKDSKFL